MPTPNYSPVGQTRVAKGSIAPARVHHVEELVCTAGSSKTEMVTHTLVNIDDFSTVCVTCGVDWATLDSDARTTAARAVRKRERERAKEERARRAGEQ